MDKEWEDHLVRLRSERKEQGLLRALPELAEADGRSVILDGRRLVNFSGNDYLGFSRETSITEAGLACARKEGNGSTGSRLMSGNFRSLTDLEESLARLTGTEKALVFNSGWNANLGILSALAERGTTVFCDRLDHASIYDGIRLSGAEMVRYRHADPEDLERKLSAGTSGRKIIVTESVFSMDGDFAPLKEIVALKEKYGCLLVVDEAHAFGIFGRQGSGCLSECGLDGRADLVMATFGKSLGVFGAFVAGSGLLIEHLVNVSRPFIFTTGLPPFVVGAASRALSLVRERSPGSELLAKARFFMDRLKEPVRQGKTSQIIPIMAGTNERALALRDHLRERGFFVQAIRPPTVPPGTARVRISLNLLHTQEDLDGLTAAIGDFFRTGAAG